LILDEATANLDDATRARLNENLHRLGLTVLRVTHRMDELAACDAVYRLERGTLSVERRTEPLRDLA
jgi:ABC-type bacteriocin/lantibiotic exporter with double-glycine peptidase domain